MTGRFVAIDQDLRPVLRAWTEEALAAPDAQCCFAEARTREATHPHRRIGPVQVTLSLRWTRS